MNVIGKARVEGGGEAIPPFQADRARGEAHGALGRDMDGIGGEFVDLRWIVWRGNSASRISG